MTSRSAKKLRDRVIDLQRELSRYKKENDIDIQGAVEGLSKTRMHLEKVWIRGN